MNSNSTRILNIDISNTSKQQLLAEIKKGGVLLTPNVDHMVKLQKDPEFYRIYTKADYVVCDSKILLWASKFLGCKIQEKISGSDFFPSFYRYYKYDESIKIFLLGGAVGVAELAKQRINRKAGRQIVVAAHSPSFGFEKQPAECREIVDLINQSGATVLAIGVGAPKQEKWLYKYKDQLGNIQIFLAIGATIDFEAGFYQRAPKWMSEVGLEWLHRFVSEPKRLWRRYLVESLPFFWLVLQQKMNFYRYKKPIGLVLQEADLLSPEQVEQILESQAASGQRFGEIAVRKGWLAPQTIHFFTTEILKLAQQEPKPIGQYLKAAALLDNRQIYAVLEEQKRIRRPFGEIVVQKGWLSRQTIDFFLALTTSHSCPVSSPVDDFALQSN
ncbi:MAG: WecB/TagA/CpsF family glycosyltransferase [Cyanophyceae cyanobacterium]